MQTKMGKLKVKRGRLTVEVDAGDLVALAIFAALLMQFLLLMGGRIEEAEKMALFASGYGLGYLLERVVTGGSKLVKRRKVVGKRPRILR